MTRLSEYLLPTERQAPADAEALSHRLMVRAGLIRQVGAGLWSWLPAGWRSHTKVVQIIREEMDRIGGLEMLMPVLGPAEPWRRTGRYDIDELFKLRDRREAELVLAMTHEEVVTTHMAALVRSYRDLPRILYHFQTKERDEPRPRAGVLRTREFIMKDSYTFDRDAEGLDARYQLHVAAYDRIFERCGLRFHRVESDVGMMGGLGAHEYMAPCPAGENEVALAPGYAANVEVARARAAPVDGLPAPAGPPEELATPGLSRVEEVTGHLGVPEGALLKAFPVVDPDGGRPTLVLLRGDHRLNEIKLGIALGRDVRAAREEELGPFGPAGFLGPVGLELPIMLDGAVATDAAYVTGAGVPGAHLRGVVPGRDFPFEVADVRRVEAGDLTDAGAAIVIEPAIEIGNIFKLGTRYSEPLGATFLDEQGREQPVWMGSYGIGPARIAAAAVEQYADEQGISWPRSIAPFGVHLVAVGKPGGEERAAAESLYRELGDAGLEVLYDDRDAGAGEKFADAELLGCPLRLTIGRRGLAEGHAEAVVRRGRVPGDGVPLENAVAAVRALWESTP